ncbi:TRAP transporter small permease subunit [Aliihoeflea aestuarii]|jgi:TRAP-type transport system small permease protein|uniref:TRAP transporter small permease n=1 Tax=Aliihoeflea aestuarii TaxID=453840 RepID=UPI00209219A6|nr:TRAP transporter small permease [Aliihoeflea aestuarii]MCO6391802.1 TRAP transporter small permease subunit [Aliihoeflea aestuarii]
MARFVRIGFGAVERVALALLILGVLGMTMACLTQVFARYALNQPLSWSEELARTLFVWVAFLAGWLAWKHRAHIALDAVFHIDPEGGRITRISRSIVEAIVLTFCAYTFYTNAGLIRLAWNQPSPVLNIPMGLVYMAYSAMAFLIVLDILVTWCTGRKPDAVDPDQSHNLSGA